MGMRRKAGPRDPDVEALVEAAGGLYDPKTLIINQSRELNAQYRALADQLIPPLERLKHLASLRGFSVSPMEIHHNNQRDAVVLLNPSSRKRGGQIYYNPSRPAGRVAFSIAHEIVHGFFPSTSGGAKFREMLSDEAQEINELEMLCHAGAAELLMPIEEFQALAGPEWTVRKAPRLMAAFGGSFEATLFRLATAYPRAAVAGLVSFRRTKGDEAKLRVLNVHVQTDLFGQDLDQAPLSVAEPKYRRQSLHPSENFPKSQMIPWNKSFDQTSCVYRTSGEHIVSASECLPIPGGLKGTIEAVDAPYQRESADPDHPDVLFFWKAA